MITTYRTPEQARNELAIVERKLSNLRAQFDLARGLEDKLKAQLIIEEGQRDHRMIDMKLRESLQQLRLGVYTRDGFWLKELELVDGFVGIEAAQRLVESLSDDRDHLRKLAGMPG
jgi:hypothetical protein